MVATAAVALLVGRLPGVAPEVKQTLVTVLIALGTTSVLDDPASSLVASSPSPLWWRRAVRLGLAAPLTSGLWWAVTSVASPGPLTDRKSVV
jgi:hypothetical protein